jgi:hypothetical protein
MQIHASSMMQITAMSRIICNMSNLVKKKCFSGSKNIKYCYISVLRLWNNVFLSSLEEKPHNEF